MDEPLKKALNCSTKPLLFLCAILLCVVEISKTACTLALDTPKCMSFDRADFCDLGAVLLFAKLLDTCPVALNFTDH